MNQHDDEKKHAYFNALICSSLLVFGVAFSSRSFSVIFCIVYLWVEAQFRSEDGKLEGTAEIIVVLVYRSALIRQPEAPPTRPKQHNYINYSKSVNAL
uniref:Uncharacterized protein n=1 Tax=Amphilophus citrinellus TaxID=61819 RepID=A0A3Q0RYX7_AMPCI